MKSQSFLRGVAPGRRIAPGVLAGYPRNTPCFIRPRGQPESIACSRSVSSGSLTLRPPDSGKSFQRDVTRKVPHVQDSQINKILDLLDEGKEHPVFVHCLKGNDRTGLVIGLHRVVNEGMAPGLAWEEMLQFDFHTRFRALTRYFESRTGFDLNEDSPDGSAQDSTLKNENE